jgi:predicted ATP-dependent serine protease
VYAVCLKCGKSKDAPNKRCSECGFKPADDDSMAKSVYLSLGRFDTRAEQSTYEYKLREIAFDQVDMDRLRRQKIEVDSVSDAGVLRYLLRVFFPGLLFLLILAGVLIVLKLL